MPELPEAEICRRALARWTAGRRVAAVHLPDPAVVRPRLSTRPSDAVADAAARLAGLVGRTAGPLLRHGKRIGVVFGDRTLLLHLGMSGRWCRAEGAPPRHARLGLGLDDGAALWFVDPRRFGCVVPLAAEALGAALREGMGPDAMAEPLDAETLGARLGGRRAVKVALMDQQVLAGLGNIHAAEALWRARIHPGRACGALSAGELSRLSAAILAQLVESLAAEEAGELVYVTEGGKNPFAIYGREGEPCPACGAAITRFVQGGRGTWLCPGCQDARAGSAEAC